MNSSIYVGRVGGLAVALGVGAAIFSGAGIAWAGPDSSTSPGPTATGPGSGGGASDVGSAIRKAVKDSISNVAAVGTRARDLGNEARTNLHDLADNVGAHLTTTSTTTGQQQRASGNNTFAAKPLAVTSLSSLGATRPRLTRAVEAFSSGPIAQSLPETLDSITAPLRVTPNTGTSTNGVAAAVAAVANQVLRPFAGNAPGTPPSPVVPLTGLTDLVQLAGLRRGLSGAPTTLDQPTASAVNPTFVLNGYKIVANPDSREKVKSFYGLFTVGPAGPGMVQGEQEYNVVDSSGTTVGTFKALVSNSNSFIFGGQFQEFVVTDTDGIGTPPVGTLVATSRSPLMGLFGMLYTSTPTGVGDERTISFKLLTPFGDIPIPLKYDAAQVLTAVNEPMQLENGYYIAPVPGSDEVPVSISGVVPLFSSYEGEQEFAMYDSEGNEVGRFKGYVTTTSDVIGGATEAIYVTQYISGPQGTAAGEIPSPGSVYNVFRSKRAIYSAVVPPGGGPAVTSFNIGTPLGAIHIPIVSRYDATNPPTFDSFSVPGKYSFVPTSDFVPIGVNGLPPREVQLQGYQKFDVVDSSGHKIGSVDADVTTQWNLTGTYVESILVTNVTPVEGMADAEVPPVGSQYSFVYYPAGGFGILYSSIPSPTGDKNTYTLLTPLGNVNVPFPAYDPVKGLGPDNVDYFVP